MGAPKNAKPLGLDGWQDEHGNAMSPDKAKVDLPRFKCNACKCRGHASELVAADDEEMMYCPQCGTAAWEWL